MEYCAVAHSVREVDHHVESRNKRWKKCFRDRKVASFCFLVFEFAERNKKAKEKERNIKEDGLFAF